MLKSKLTLRVGFDLDGVILYNPARIARPLIAQFKKIFLHKKKLGFYYPKSPFEKKLWSFFHRSSIFIAPGFSEIKKLTRQNKIKAYIITARFDFMKVDFQKWVKKNNIQQVFINCFHNQDDEQPHLLKEKMIKKLDLDIYVEDNWDIVQYLNKKFPDKKIYWIYNICDRANNYPYKFPTLQKAVDQIKKIT